MAFASLLRRSAASAAPLAIRALGRSRGHISAASTLSSVIKHGAAAASRQHLYRSSFLRYSTAVEKVPKTDLKLIQVLESEIECAEGSDEQEEVVDVPASFPFEIVDNTGEQVLKLTRKYDDETIEVEVYMPDLITGDEHDEDEDDKGEDDSENSPQSTLPLLIKISKNSGPSLEFSCSANADEINIDNLSIKDPETPDDMAYDGPQFGDLDESLQKAFHKYLNVRGITPSATNFLHEYMINKDGREYNAWLKNLKKFVEA